MITLSITTRHENFLYKSICSLLIGECPVGSTRFYFFPFLSEKVSLFLLLTWPNQENHVSVFSTLSVAYAMLYKWYDISTAKHPEDDDWPIVLNFQNKQVCVISINFRS